MQVKLEYVIGSLKGLNELVEQKIPTKISYRINKLVKKLSPEVDSFNKVKNDLIIELGEKQEDGSHTIKDPEKMKEFLTKIQEVLNETIEVDFELIKVEDLGDVTIAPKELPMWMFE